MRVNLEQQLVMMLDANGDEYRFVDDSSVPSSHHLREMILYHSIEKTSIFF